MNTPPESKSEPGAEGDRDFEREPRTDTGERARAVSLLHDAANFRCFLTPSILPTSIHPSSSISLSSFATPSLRVLGGILQNGNSETKFLRTNIRNRVFLRVHSFSG